MKVKDEVQVEIKIAWRNITRIRYADTPAPILSKEELGSLLMKAKEESEKKLA